MLTVVFGVGRGQMDRDGRVPVNNIGPEESTSTEKRTRLTDTQAGETKQRNALIDYLMIKQRKIDALQQHLNLSNYYDIIYYFNNKDIIQTLCIYLCRKPVGK